MVILFLLFLSNGLDTLQLSTIFHEPYLAGVRPEFTSFSPDQKRIYFTWNDSSRTERHTYSVAVSDHNLQYHDEAPEARAVVSPDNRHWVYQQNSNLWINGLRYDEPLLLLESEHTVSDLHWLNDNQTILFRMDGNVWSFRRDPASFRQLTNREYSNQDHIDLQILSVTGDGRFIVLQERNTSDHREILFPEYVDTFVSDGMSRRGQADTAIYLWDNESQIAHLLFDGEWAVSNYTISTSDNYLAIDRIDHTMKQREILRYDLSAIPMTEPDLQTGEGSNHNEFIHSNGHSSDSLDNNTNSLVKDSLIGESDAETEIRKARVVADTLFAKSTEGWVYPLLHTLKYAPESDILLFTSEISGWNHIYTVYGNETKPQQRTDGTFEVPWADWETDRFILFASTRADPGERRIYRLDLRDNSTRELTSKEAWRDNFHLNRDRNILVYEKSYWNRPTDIYILNLDKRQSSETRITDSVPDQFYKIDWQQPEYVRFAARDNETLLSMTILRPSNFDPDKTYPAIVFVHGAGSLQNVYKGWSASYPREYMFHQYLNQRGYVVVEVDYRHSTGYGRDFREDVANWMGRYELKDILAGLDYVDTHGGYIDRDRVGIYGGSYGGFMALYAVSHARDYFHAGAALRAVTNWENYYYANPWYTRARLGTPDEHPEHYLRSSPISYADTLSRPVILFHGLMDDNVGFQDAMQYVDRLIDTGNTDFELMVYPSERHSFVAPEAWYDEYFRIYQFFEKHLK